MFRDWKIHAIAILLICTSFAQAEVPLQLSGARGDFPNDNTEYLEDGDECEDGGLASDVTTVEELGEGEGNSLLDFEVKVGEGELTCENRPPCKYNPDSEKPAPGGTFDNCIYRGTGPICNGGQTPPKCCEVKTENGSPTTECDCIGDFGAIATNSADCAKCLCSAEAGGEPQRCVDWMTCVAKGDAPGGDFCRAITAHSGNAWRYSAGRCVCDRYGDGGAWKLVDHDNNRKTPKVWRWITAYNQNYCNCASARKAGNPAPDQGAWTKCSAAYNKAVNTNFCDSVRWTHYAVGKCPCESSRIIQPTKKCGAHVFCECR